MEQHNVRVRVQVIDAQPSILSTTVATYLPMDQLTQLIARESGLQAFWPNGVRRLYWLRARGRLLQPHQTLADIGIVGDELVYLLPQPPPDMSAFEQSPDYPKRNPYLGQGYPVLFLSLIGIMFWGFGWCMAIQIRPTWWISMLPGFGFGVLNVHFARHIWGGRASRLRVLITALLFMILMAVFSMFSVLSLPNIGIEMDLGEFFKQFQLGLLCALVSIIVAFLAWWGPVEPLTVGPDMPQEIQQEVALPLCGICGAGVEPDVKVGCQYGCGKIFHTGCYAQVMRSYRDDKRFCAVCRDRIA